MPHPTFKYSNFYQYQPKFTKMKLLKPVILFSVGALAHSGWTIPKDHPSGVYRVAKDASGNSKHVLVRDLSASTESAIRNAVISAAGLSKRENTGINEVKCLEYQLDATDVKIAADNLVSQCGSGGFMEENTNYYSISGNAVTYVCNYAKGPNVCYGSDVRDAMEDKITGLCGNYVAGYDHVMVRGLRYGYGKKDAQMCDGRGIEGKDDD